MLLGFKRRFAPFVEDGTKTHTIRGLRKITPRVGEIAHCYVDPRQKTMRLLGRWPIVRVEQIVITEFLNPMIPLAVSVSGILLTADETQQLFWCDGFRDAVDDFTRYPAITLAAQFWKEQLKAGAFRGHLIHWGRP